MRVLADDGDVNRGLETLGQRLEEMRHELGRQAADGFAREFSFEHTIGAARKIDRDAYLGFVHRQHETVARKAELGAESLAQRFADGERAILDGVMLVDLEISVTLELE